MAICDLSFVSALLTMIKFSMHKRVRILNSKANVKGQILQLNTSIPLKCGTGCVIIKLKSGRVGMQGRIQTLVLLGGTNFGEGSRGPPRPLLV